MAAHKMKKASSGKTARKLMDIHNSAFRDEDLNLAAAEEKGPPKTLEGNRGCGWLERCRNIARRMKELEFETEAIEKATGLTLQEIENL